MNSPIGWLLLNALHRVGRTEWKTVTEEYSLFDDHVILRFDTHGREKSVTFRIPSEVVDPVAYAKAEWPEWFGERGQLDLFPKQE